MKIGCNYWASHAGTNMWNTWDEEIVKQDFKRMAEIGCNLVRVFPNWQDFQPIELLHEWKGIRKHVRFRGGPLPETPCGRAGVDEEMIRRFRVLTEIAAENKIDLIVGVVTGWMSGTLFIPPALQGLNIYTDPLALKWQIRFIRCFVRELKDCSAIKYWELGNESNCMSPCDDPSAEWNWTYIVSSAIRLEDPARPVSSGMHTLVPRADEFLEEAFRWSIEAQGELCDLMTGHPYPQTYSKYSADLDQHSSIRLSLQSSAEILLYSDIGKRPGAVEEIGTFAPTFCSEKEKADFLQHAIYNSWVHGSEFFLWWCAFEQSELDFPPYTLSAGERELGLFKTDFTKKPVADKILEFREFEKKLPFKELPPFRRNAVCILTRQDEKHCIGNSWCTFLLSKLAGFDIKFHYSNDGKLDKSNLYIVPCLHGDTMNKEGYMDLLQNVREGATAYISLDYAWMAPFREVFGVEVITQEARLKPAEFTFAGERFSINDSRRMILRSTGAEVLASEDDGNPVFVRNSYGKGTIYLLTLPFEFDLISKPRSFERGSAEKVRKIYQAFAGPALAERHLFSEDPLITLTEHFDGSTWWCIAVNNGPDTKIPGFTPAAGWKIDGPVTQMTPGSALVLRMTEDRKA